MADSRSQRAEPSDGGRSLQALERLRERVEAAAAEIERLRAENAELAARVRELAALEAAGGGADALRLALDEEPEALREKIEGFIAAIDRMLAEPAAEDEAEPSESSS